MGKPIKADRVLGVGSLLSYRWIILGVITLTHVMNVYSYRSIQALAPLLQLDFNLQYFQIGMLTSLYFMGAILLSVPMGWLVDRVGVYWTIAVGQFVVGLFVLSISFAHSFLIICGLLFLAGMGHGPINPATGKAVMLWFSKEGRATAMGIKQTGIPIGGALAAATIPTIALILAWRKAIIISGAISLISVLVCLLFYKDSTKGDVDKIHQPLPL